MAKSKSVKKSAFGKKASRKGQAMMEYLITYGFAIFIIVFVLAVLLTVVLPSLKPPENCQFSQPGYSCSTKQHVIVSDPSLNNVKVIFQLDNQQGKGVEIKNILCSDQPAGNIQKEDVTTNGKAISGTDSDMVPGESTTFTVDCKGADGSVVVLAPNSNFKGTIAILYRFKDEVSGTGVPSRMATATLTGNVQAG